MKMTPLEYASIVRDIERSPLSLVLQTPSKRKAFQIFSSPYVNLKVLGQTDMSKWKYSYMLTGTLRAMCILPKEAIGEILTVCISASIGVHYIIIRGTGDRGFWHCYVASLVIYCIEPPRRIVTKSPVKDRSTLFCTQCSYLVFPESCHLCIVYIYQSLPQKIVQTPFHFRATISYFLGPQSSQANHGTGRFSREYSAYSHLSYP